MDIEGEAREIAQEVVNEVRTARQEARIDLLGDLIDELWSQYHTMSGERAEGMLSAINYLSRFQRLDNRFPVKGW